MAIIGKIRQRSGLVIALIGVALLAFVLTDALNSKFGFSGGRDNIIGVIGGKDITYEEFNKLYETYENNVRNQYNMDKIDDMTRDMIRDQVWNDFIKRNITEKEYEKLGLRISEDELFDMIQGPDPYPQIKQAPAFTNPQTGQFDPSLVIRYLKQIDQDPEGTQKKQWVEFEKMMVEQTLTEKYNALIKKGIYVNSLEAAHYTAAGIDATRGKVVGSSFMSVPDTAVTFNDKDLEKYLTENKEQFKQEESRKIEYVYWSLEPTRDDTLKIQKWAEEQKESFAKATNDTLYLELNSETPLDTNFKAISALDASINEELWKLDSGAVAGPYLQGGRFVLYKVRSAQDDSIYYMRASHILVRPENATREDSLEAVKKANALLARVRGGEDFAELAKTESADGSASQGGDLGWFSEGTMVTPFNDAVKNGKTGDLVVVRSQFGAHLIKITANKTKRKLQIAELSRSIEPSSETIRNIYAKANQFAAMTRKGADFAKNVEDQGLLIRVADNIKKTDKSLPAINQGRPVVQWMFDKKTDVGDVSDVLELSDRFLVAHLQSKKEEGFAKLDDVRQNVERLVIMQKKAELLKKKFDEPAKSAKTAEEFALTVGAIVSDVDQKFGDDYINGVGTDPRLLGYIKGAPVNQTFGPVKGTQGVYVLFIAEHKTEKLPDDMAQTKAQMLDPRQSRADFEAQEAIKKMADIKDNRYRFF